MNRKIGPKARAGGAVPSFAGSRSRHWLDVRTPGLLQHEWSDGTSVSFRDPNVSFEDGRLTALAAAHLANLGANKTFDELRQRMAASNPLHFFLLIDALQRWMRRQGVSAHGYDPLQELVGGILTSLDPQVVMSRRHITVSEDDFTGMERLVRQLAAHAAQARVGDYLEDIDERAVDTRFLLIAEEQFDRTAGYPEVLREIASDVLTQLDDLAPEIGFRLSDALRAAEAHLEDQLIRLRAAHDALQPAHRRQGKLFTSLWRIASISRHDPVPTVAGALSIDPDVARRLIDCLATPLGSQKLTSLTRSNRLRHFPVLKLLDGTYIWPSPHDLVHEVLEWADLCLADLNQNPARGRLSRARSATTERLTAQALADVYGQDRVIRNAEYRDPDGGNWVETDAVIDLGTAAVIVEAKSQRITPQGRSGATGRVRTKVNEFLVRPLSQTARASRALLGGCEVRARHHDPTHVSPAVVRRLIVNLDRVDPFVAHARDLVENTADATDSLQTDAWIVCLADLLVVTHMLRTPTELWAYHGKRAAQTATGLPTINMETDALGAWLKSREGAWPTRDGHEFQLAFSSEQINLYFNDREHRRQLGTAERRPVLRPTGGIPSPVLDAMTSLIGDPIWAYASDVIANVIPTEWARFRRDLRRLHSKPTSRRQRRSLEAVKRGIAYGRTPQVVIRPNGEPRLELTNPIDLAPDITEGNSARGYQGMPTVTLTLRPTLPQI